MLTTNDPKQQQQTAPPRSFRFNATRTDVAALLARQRDRLIHSAVLSAQAVANQQPGATSQLPLAYRMRGLAEGAPQTLLGGRLVNSTLASSTNSPQLFGSIDYVNVNQQLASSRTTQAQLAANQPQAQLGSGRLSLAHSHLQAPHTQGQSSLTSGGNAATEMGAQFGLKLVCDIDQVFPVPEVSIYRLAKLDGSHPDKLAKLETKIERDVRSGLFHVQVTSILDDQELLQMRNPKQISSSWPGWSAASNTQTSQTLAQNDEQPIYFECLISLTNLELSKYADNKRSIIYHPSKCSLLRPLSSPSSH